ncbi:hypothetical protein PMAYCL1PPCAC_01510, partial [Pristionchus mayeri]
INQVPPTKKPTGDTRKCDICGDLVNRYTISPSFRVLSANFFSRMINPTPAQLAASESFIDRNPSAIVCMRHFKKETITPKPSFPRPTMMKAKKTFIVKGSVRVTENGIERIG